VDIPEKLGVRTIICPFDLNQMMRIAIYLLIITTLTIFISIYFVILSAIAIPPRTTTCSDVRKIAMITKNKNSYINF
jgi:hypothetical protein